MVDFDTHGIIVASLVGIAALGASWWHRRGWIGDRQTFADALGETPDSAAPHAVGRSTRILRWVAIAGVVIAAGAPEREVSVAARLAEPTLVVVLDVSMSMRAADIEPSRLDEAKRQLARTLGEVRVGRIALVAFAAAPTVICPPTTDHLACADLLDATDETSAVPGPTLAAPAVARALELIGLAGGAILVVSDGELPDEDRRRLREVTRDARQRGVRVSTLGVGTPTGAPVPVRGQIGRMQADESGALLSSYLDEAMLEWLAGEGDGVHARLVPGGVIELGQLAPGAGPGGRPPAARWHPFGPVSYFGYPLSLGLALLVGDAWRAWRRRRA